jgi:DNA-binding MarR family transcriptional regulator
MTKASASLRTDTPLLEERRNSPGLLLALVGDDAMRELRQAHTDDGMTPRQYHLLALLDGHGPMGQSELGAAVGTDPSVLVTQLNPLEDEGFISRDRDPSDRRRHVVSLTTAGAKKLRDATRSQERVEDALLSALDAEEREQLQSLLIAIRDSRQSDGGAPCEGGHG